MPIDFAREKSSRAHSLAAGTRLAGHYLEPLPRKTPADEAEMRQTVQELMQEREITYRNLLAAYLRLQEVNRQKTVFLASAAHELKTPLAVMKGYYDLLLTGSLGKLDDRQREILLESKESCDRLVRLVSMFLNYSALESGKLVLQLRENDLRDCIKDLTCRWQDAFQRAKVRLDIQDSSGADAVQIRLPESAAVHGEFAGQRAEAHASGRLRHLGRRTALLGTAHVGSSAFGRPPSRPGSHRPIACWFPCRTPAAESPRSFIRKFSKNLCAWIPRLRGWAWAWRSPSA